MFSFMLSKNEGSIIYFRLYNKFILILFISTKFLTLISNKRSLYRLIINHIFSRNCTEYEQNILVMATPFLSMRKTNLVGHIGISMKGRSGKTKADYDLVTLLCDLVTKFLSTFLPVSGVDT